jgi:hypothetical protein
MAISRIRRDSRGAAAYSANASGLAVDSDTNRLEINIDGTRRQIDATRLIAAGSSVTLTSKDSGSIVCLDTAAGSTVTLPSATGSGATFKILVTVTATSNSHKIQVANASDEMRGFVIADASEATAPNIWWAADNDDTITLNRTTTGTAAQGQYFEIIDAAANHFFVRGFVEQSGSEATPFSAAVS